MKLEQKTERLQQQIGKLEERQGKQASLKDTLQELRQETAPPSAWEKRKTEGSDPIKGSFLKGGESHERRNNHYLSCFGVRGVP